jgi:hypothetical protein
MVREQRAQRRAVEQAVMHSSTQRATRRNARRLVAEHGARLARLRRPRVAHAH